MSRTLSALLLSASIIVLPFASSISAAELPPAAEQEIDFARDIKPIFANHCMDCHGPDTQEAGFRLDNREAALDGGDGGKSILPQKSVDSPLLNRVARHDPETMMPPDGLDPLSEEQVSLLRAWIDQGANWPKSESAEIKVDHWAFKPVTRPEVPEVSHQEWVQNEIDQFVLAKLEQKELTPSEEADRYTLIRRLYLDLIGIAPTPEEVNAFVNDDSPEAYETIVDRLLASPHFGERWGRHWLDMARYADSDGYEKDNPRPNAWRYRDWVINAINDDMPYDQFTREQLAGDLLDHPTKMQQLATAFHRQTLTNTEGGTDQEQWRVEAVFDRVETTGAIWLGLTVGCARCHTHKYDAISQREYYQMFSFFNNGDETTTAVPKSVAAEKEYETTKANYDHKISDLKTQLIKAKAETADQFAAWETRTQEKIAREMGDPLQYHAMTNDSVTAPQEDTFEKLEDGSWLAKSRRADKGQYKVTGQSTVTDQSIVALRLEAIPDESLPNNGSGQAGYGNFVLSEFRIYQQKEGQPSPLKIKSVTADFSQDGFSIQKAIDGKLDTGWAIKPQYSEHHEATFVLAEPITLTADEPLTIEIDQEYGTNHNLGRFKLTLATGTVPDSSLSTEDRAILAKQVSERTEDETQQLRNVFYQHSQPTKGLIASLNKLKKNPPPAPNMTVRVISQRNEEPRTTHIMRRGDFLQPMDEVLPGTLQVLNPLDHDPASATRIDLVDWLFAEGNPLTARVSVNQIWAKLFGEGIVATINDFGVRGDKPTHPELFDWLATEYRRLGWSRKAFIKTIVMSSTYRQSTVHRPEFAEIDPLNKLLHRQNRLRVEAEIVRDLSLQASGLLSLKIGGPSVFPPLPPEIAALSYANNFKWNTSDGEDQYRRGMYTFFKRTSPHPNLINFDCPDSNTTCLIRRTSNTPLQALQALNNDIFHQSAIHLAKRLLTSDLQSSEERLEQMVMLTSSRPLDSFEQNAYLELLEESRAWYEAHPEEATELAEGFDMGALPNTSPTELAAWVATCRIALNLDDFFSRP
ncbi:Planctomycete cytochrome C [Polystyrenella longa]|uniref:Planctomycete cytochrome C n=1 Tax=Polystyrenella longa TaxID=2528007 RepID=A0A518CS38_9PLAN|nr:PSD1 and planctomycete cytochrome C domain-containing protein [Polystyrenella longa]QDU82049.1 Planctomycete cytochrome C [Polystyrenella longa]